MKTFTPLLAFFLLTAMACQSDTQSNEHEDKEAPHLDLPVFVCDDALFYPYAHKKTVLSLGYLDAAKTAHKLRIFDEQGKRYPLDKAGIEKFAENHPHLWQAEKSNLHLKVDKSIPMAVLRYVEYLFLDKGINEFSYLDEDGKSLLAFRPNLKLDPCEEHACFSMEYFSKMDLAILSEYKIIPESNPIHYKKKKTFSNENPIFSYVLSRETFNPWNFKEELQDFFELPSSPIDKLYFLNVNADVPFGEYHQIHGTINKVFNERWNERSLLEFSMPFGKLNVEQRTQLMEALPKRLSVDFWEGC